MHIGRNCKPEAALQHCAHGSPKAQILFADPLSAISHLRAQTDTIMLAFSGGKDSLCAWLRLREHFPRIVPVFQYWIPGLQFVDRTLDYYEQYFATKIIRVPHPGWYDAMRYGLFQTPVTFQVTDSYSFRRVTFDQQRDWIAADLGIERWMATGMRAADSVRRLLTIRKIGCLSNGNRKLYPIADLTKADVIAMLRAHGVKLPPEYAFLRRSFDGLQETYLSAIRMHWPRDYATIQRWLPLIEAEFVRRKVHEAHAT